MLCVIDANVLSDSLAWYYVMVLIVTCSMKQCFKKYLYGVDDMRNRKDVELVKAAALFL